MSCTNSQAPKTKKLSRETEPVDAVEKTLIEQSEALRKSLRKSVAEKKGRRAIEDGVCVKVRGE